MNVDELTESMHATSVPVPFDLDRVTRDGRRIRTRRRATVAGGLAAVLVAVAVPVALWQQADDPAAPQVAGTPDEPDARPDDARERAFEADAPVGTPAMAVLQPGGEYAPKFYLGGRRLRSVGALSLWTESDGLVFGARLVDGDGSLRRAGVLDLDALDLTSTDGGPTTLVRVPFQNPGEPTFVGLVPVPEGTRDALLLRVRSEDAVVRSGVRYDVVPDRALVWVTATAGTAAGTDLAGWTVRDPAGGRLASGGFEGPTTGAWAPGR